MSLKVRNIAFRLIMDSQKVSKAFQDKKVTMATLGPLYHNYAHISAFMMVCNTPAPHHHLHLSFYRYMGEIFYHWRSRYALHVEVLSSSSSIWCTLIICYASYLAHWYLSTRGMLLHIHSLVRRWYLQFACLHEMISPTTLRLLPPIAKKNTAAHEQCRMQPTKLSIPILTKDNIRQSTMIV